MLFDGHFTASADDDRSSKSLMKLMDEVRSEQVGPEAAVQ